MNRVLGIIIGLALAVAVDAQPVSHDLDTHPVRFAIIGDRTGGHTPGVFDSIVIEIQRLRPDFVVTVGDMIEGYTEDTAVLNSEWAEYRQIIAPFTMPVFHTGGNHDLINDASIAAYREQFGEPEQSFRHLGLHFIMLDNSRHGQPNQWTPEQLAWVRSELEANRDAARTFVFFHKPFWYNTVSQGKPDSLHRILVEYGVDAVVTGHFHRYFSGEFDGIKYMSVGSSGGSMSPKWVGLGYHFVWVTVDTSDIHFAVIDKASVMPWDVIKVQEMFDAARVELMAVQFGRPVPVGEDLRINNGSLTVELSNQYSSLAATDSLVWSLPDGWRVEPAVVPVSLAPGERKSFDFTVTNTGALFPVPTVSVLLPYKEGQAVRAERPLCLGRQALAALVEQSVAIDGNLSEAVWQQPASGLFADNGAVSPIDPTEFFFARDRENLYIAARCRERNMAGLKADVSIRDGSVYSEDCVGYFFQPDTGSPVVYQIYISPQGAVYDSKIEQNNDGYFAGDQSWNGDYEIAASRGTDAWTVEARIPLAQLGVRSAATTTWGVNFRRKQHQSKLSASWQVPLEYNPETFGRLALPEATR